MNAPRTILLGVDLLPSGELTEGCRVAANAAKTIASDVGAQVVLVHSTRKDEYWNPLKRGLVVVTEGVNETGRKAVESLAAEFREAGSECDTVFSEDKPYVAIAREAQRRNVDLVVAGKHNRAECDAEKLGNVAKRILHYCPCRVLVVGPNTTQKPSRILAATDLTPVGENAVQSGAWLAGHHNCDLHVVHAYRFSLEDQIDPSANDNERHEELRNAAREVIASELQGTGFEESAEVHIGFGAPDAVVQEAVATLKPDLVVLGTLSRGGIAGFLTGNTAERLLDRIPAAILAVKPDDFESPVKL